MDKQQKIDKQTFKQIFIDHFERFQQKNSGYDTDYYTEVIEKMLNCAEKENGYANYRCMECGKEKIVTFTCKSSFCLFCARIKLKKWLRKIMKFTRAMTASMRPVFTHHIAILFRKTKLVDIVEKL